MSEHDSEDEFEMSLSGSPPPLETLLSNPYHAVLEQPPSSFAGRVTRSRSFAIPPLKNPNSDFLSEDESALQTAEVSFTGTSASRVQNFGAVAQSSISAALEPPDLDVKTAFAEMTKILASIAPKIPKTPPWHHQRHPTHLMKIPSRALSFLIPHQQCHT